MGSSALGSVLLEALSTLPSMEKLVHAGTTLPSLRRRWWQEFAMSPALETTQRHAEVPTRTACTNYQTMTLAARLLLDLIVWLPFLVAMTALTVSKIIFTLAPQAKWFYAWVVSHGIYYMRAFRFASIISFPVIPHHILGFIEIRPFRYNFWANYEPSRERHLVSPEKMPVFCLLSRGERRQSWRRSLHFFYNLTFKRCIGLCTYWAIEIYSTTAVSSMLAVSVNLSLEAAMPNKCFPLLTVPHFHTPTLIETFYVSALTPTGGSTHAFAEVRSAQYVTYTVLYKNYITGRTRLH